MIQDIGLSIRQVMSRKKISQLELSKTIGCSRVSINRLVNGHTGIRLEMFIKIMKELDIDINELLKSKVN